MNRFQNPDIRLTDALERELLEEAIRAQHDYAFDRAMKQFFHKIASLFSRPQDRASHSVRMAH